jgi:hypothetical protein
MNIVIYTILIILLIIVVLANIAPKSYDVSRSILIKKPVPEVYQYLKLLKNQDNWSPWVEKDPNMKKTFTGTDGQLGFTSAWVGNKDVGEGEQELTGFVENRLIESRLNFFKPFKSTSDAYLKLKKKGNHTKVTWGFTGKNKFPMSIMMLFMSMDKMIGKDFEYGLNKLKEILEP